MTHEAQQLDGQVVRYFRHPDVSGEPPCTHCGHAMDTHGVVVSGEASMIVCPGDWTISGSSVRHSPDSLVTPNRCGREATVGNVLKSCENQSDHPGPCWYNVPC